MTKKPKPKAKAKNRFQPSEREWALIEAELVQAMGAWSAANPDQEPLQGLELLGKFIAAELRPPPPEDAPREGWLKL